MDPFKKDCWKSWNRCSKHTGRILRGMSLSRRMPLESAGWQPPVDIYEAGDHIHVYADLAGVAGDSLRVTVDGRHLHISGFRELPPTMPSPAFISSKSSWADFSGPCFCRPLSTSKGSNRPTATVSSW
jgi:HSP20 family molecular chaperone IbpA